MFAVALWLGYLLLCLLDLGLLIVLSITVLCYLVLVARGDFAFACVFGLFVWSVSCSLLLLLCCLWLFGLCLTFGCLWLVFIWLFSGVGWGDC